MHYAQANQDKSKSEMILSLIDAIEDFIKVSEFNPHMLICVLVVEYEHRTHVLKNNTLHSNRQFQEISNGAVC